MQAVPNVSRVAELLKLLWHETWEIEAQAVLCGLDRRDAEPIRPLGFRRRDPR